MRLRILLPAVLCAAAAACSKSSPSNGPTAPGSSNMLEGRAVMALDGAAVPRAQVHISGRAPVFADADGHFAVQVAGPGSFVATVSGGTIVERQTTITGPTAEQARVSLIPAGFDLAAFDEMYRMSGDRLLRWTSRPSLVVLGSVMSYRTGNSSEFHATGEQLTGEEVDLMIAQLTEGLGLLTGQVYTAFESVTVERPDSGARVSVDRPGRIVVGRYSGIVTMVNTIGYGQWSEQPDGTVTGGAMFLDRDFDRGDPRRRLLRIHELGHALGIQHVRARTSIMNPAVGPEPTDFDRAAGLIAYQRPPGNRSPDIDPSTSNRPFSLAEGGSRLMPPVFCR